MSATECHTCRDALLISNQILDPEVQIRKSHAKQNYVPFQGLRPRQHFGGSCMVHERRCYPCICKGEVALVKDLLERSTHDDLVCFF